MNDNQTVGVDVLVAEAAGIIRTARGLFVELAGSCPVEVEKHLQVLASGYLQLFKNLIPGWGLKEASAFIVDVSPPGTPHTLAATSPHLES